MSLLDIFLIFAVITNVMFAALIYIHSKKELVVSFYALISFFAGVWAIATFLMQASLSSPVFSAAATVHYIGGNLAYLSFFWFAAYYPFQTFKNVLVPALISLGNLAILAAIPFSDFFFAQLRPEPLLAESITFNLPGYAVFVSYLTGVFLLGEALLFFKLFQVKAGEQRRISYVILATFVAGTLGIVFNLIFPWFGNFDFFTINPILVTIALTVFGLYNILYNRIFAIKIIATELLTIAIWIVTLYNTLSAKTREDQIIQGTVFGVVVLFGYFLVKGVLTEIRQKEELQQAYQKLEEVDRAKSEFVSIASHQLRTPLTAMKGYISMLLEGSYGLLDTRQKKPIESVYTSSERLIRLVNDLLNVSRIESGKIEMKWEQGSVEEIIKSVVEELGIKAKEKDVQLVFEEPKSSLPLIRIDKEKIRNVVLNIVDNAIRYTPHGMITLSAVLQQENVLIRIQDTGEGMTQEEIGKLFQTFSRGGAGMRFSTEGAGLGLYIAKKFLEMHKGRIFAESAGKGQGSTFFVELPVA